MKLSFIEPGLSCKVEPITDLAYVVIGLDGVVYCITSAMMCYIDILSRLVQI